MRAIAVLMLALAGALMQGAWTPQVSGVTATFRGVSAVDAEVAWVSGSRGTVLRTDDGGVTWRAAAPDGAAALDFRDVDAIDRNTAFILSIGNGDASRIFKTTDAGATWVTQFTNTDPDAFFDAMAFWDGDRGLAFSDSANGRLHILRSLDAGRTWLRLDPAGLPAALDNEGAFAASGTNIATWGSRHAWIGTGAAARSRVLRTTDGGDTWQVADTPLAAGATSGIYSIAFRDDRHGMVVGGDYTKEADAVDNAAFTSDGGVTWSLVRGLRGFRSVIVPMPGGTGRSWMALGPSGADWSDDDGANWSAMEMPTRGLHTFSLSRDGRTGWAAGGRGAVARFSRR